MEKDNKTSIFIEKARKVHGDKYDYSKVVYGKNYKEKVCIICPEHGEFFQSPNSHLNGRGCPKCGKISSTKKSTLTKEKFVEKANEVHKGKYDYSEVKYINNHTKVCIICPEHGEFWQTPHLHMKKRGCPECGKIKAGRVHLRFTQEEFIKKANEVHKEKYNYSKVNYTTLNEKVCIICPEHGEFWQLPNLHISGAGCPKCAHIQEGLNKRINNEEFIKLSREVHGDFYDYSKAEYITAKHKVCIICPKHGEFWQSPWNHYHGAGCPKCSHPVSKQEQEICEHLKTSGVTEIITNSRDIIEGKELDIYLPEYKIAIEYNGLFWHTQRVHGDKNYHLKKLELCREKGIKLIQIFEDEYVQHKDIVLSKISHLLHVSQNLPKIMGRKCIIKEINKKTSKEFLDKNHIQGAGPGSLHLGAYYNDTLIGVMSFRLEKGIWELTRFASHNSYICQGVGGKLFKYFIRNYNPKEVKSFADRRWTLDEENNIYLQLGFKFERYWGPQYRYYKPQNGALREHKFNFRKNKLHKKYNLPLSMTETEMTEKLGYTKIYDCGLIKYVWRKM